MDIFQTANLQVAFFMIILVGMALTKKGIITAEGKKCLTDLVVYAILPCNIIKSYLMPFKGNLWETFSHVFLAGLFHILLMMLLNHFVFNRYAPRRKKVLQYASLIPNSGFIGYPVAEGVYGALGLFYASIYLIPLRIVMWSVGTSYFIANQMSRKELIKKIVTHPCLIAVYIGLFIMLSHISLPPFITLTVKYIGNCNAAITMFTIGTILAHVPLRTIFNKDSFMFCLYRLFIIPAFAWGIARFFGLDAVATGTAVVLMGMPAGATTAIFADRYGSDAAFATQITVLSTLLSMATVVFWCTVMPSP